MSAYSEKKSSKKLKKVKKTKRSIEQSENLEGTRKIKTMAPIPRRQGKNGEATTTTTSPNGNINHQPRRQKNNSRNFNRKPQGPQQNSRGDPVSKQEFIADGRPYGKKNGHQGTISIPSGSQPKLKTRVTLPPIKTAEEQENHNNLIKEALQKGSSQGSFDEQRIRNEQLGVTTHEYDPRTTMPTPIPTTLEVVTSTLSPITTTMVPTVNYYLVYAAIFGLVVVGGLAMCCWKFIGKFFRKNPTDDSPPPLPIAAAAAPKVSRWRRFWDWLHFWKKRESTPDEYVHLDKIPYTKNRSRRIIPSANRGPDEIQRLNNEPNRRLADQEHGKTVLKNTGRGIIDVVNKKQPKPAPKNNEEQKHDEDAAAKNYDDSLKRSIADEEKSFKIQLLVYDEPVGSSTDSGFEKTLEDLRGAGKGNMNEKQPAEPNKEAEKAEEDAAVREFEDSLKRTVEDEGKSKENQKRLEELEEETRRIRKEIKEQEERHRRDTSSDAGDFAEADEMDRQFREKLAEQNRIFNEKMEQLREERREKQRLADEEFQELRRQMQLRIAAVLACMQLKQRFIEKKEEWEDFLKKLRDLLVKIVNSYYDLQKEVKNFDSTDEFSQDCLYSEGKMFAKKVANAQHMFSNAFDNLKVLTENYDDRIFIKMIMKSISKQARLCDDVGEELVNVLDQKSKDIRKLDELVSRIDSQGIPTTGKLTKESVHAREEDYVDIEDVSLPEWFRYFM